MTVAVERRFAATIVYTGELRVPARFNTERLAAAIDLAQADTDNTASSRAAAARALCEQYPAMPDNTAHDYMTAARLVLSHDLVQEATA